MAYFKNVLNMLLDSLQLYVRDAIFNSFVIFFSSSVLSGVTYDPTTCIKRHLCRLPNLHLMSRLSLHFSEIYLPDAHLNASRFH